MGNEIQSLPPTSAAHAKILILGTLPGPLSLELRQYYAQPSNSLWDIMYELVGIPRGLPYPERTKRLAKSCIALWDVLESGERLGAQDSRIRNPIANHFAPFIAEHVNIELICFNGKKAATYYQRLVVRKQRRLPRVVDFQTLPSTSKANTSMTSAERLSRWRQILNPPSLPYRSTATGLFMP